MKKPADIFPFWKHLDSDRQASLERALMQKHYPKGASLLRQNACIGLFYVLQGQLRAYIVSDEGKEITLYRLVEGDTCVLGAKCMVRNFSFDIHINAEEDTSVVLVPVDFFEKLNEQNMHVKNYTLELIAARFSEVMWVLEQRVFSNMGKRLSLALLDRASLSQDGGISATHEQLANDLGSAREVVTRLLRQFQSDGLVKLHRNKIEILDYTGLMNI
jgi:CRP/FNR family transcriptional regulator